MEKQISVYSSDDSEETRAKLQQLNDELIDAQEDLQDKEYEKYISDQESLLDDFMDTLQDWADARLDNIDAEFQDIINMVNANSGGIYSTISGTGSENNYVVSDAAKDSWNGSGSASFNILDHTYDSCETIQEQVAKMPTTSDIENYLNQYFNDDTSKLISTMTSTKTITSDMNTTIKSVDKSLSKIASNVEEYTGKDELTDTQYIKDQLKDVKSSVQEISKYMKQQLADYETETDGFIGLIHSKVVEIGEDLDAVVWDMNQVAEALAGTSYGEVHHMNSSTNYNSSDYYNYLYLKSIGAFAKGGVVGGSDTSFLDYLAHAVGEDHMIAAKEGERILTEEQNESFEKLLSMGLTPIDEETQKRYNTPLSIEGLGNVTIPDVSTTATPTNNVSSVANNVTVGDISINLPQVTNKQEFISWLKTDGQAEKIIQSMTVDRMLGGNSYNKLKY